MSEWIAYYSLEPQDDKRGDLQAAIIASTFVNSQRKPEDAIPIDEFMPKFEEPEEEVSDWHTQLAFVEVLNMAFGGKDLRNHDS